MKILMLDNYDSFTYNLVHILRKLGYGEQLDIYRNDKIALEEVAAYDKILLSPGPGIPSEAGIMPQILKEFASSKSILGICLGHQAIAENFGGSLKLLHPVKHGIESRLNIINPSGIFEDVPQHSSIGHYHSWVVDPDSLPDQLEITARDEDDIIMALQHKRYHCTGLQFHPESIMTPSGEKMIENWLTQD